MSPVGVGQSSQQHLLSRVDINFQATLPYHDPVQDTVQDSTTLFESIIITIVDINTL